MSITDELREFASHLDLGKVALAGWKEGLLAIADRIDAEHQKAEDEWKAKHGQMWLKGYSECHAELLEGNETLASDLEGCGWIRLPKDADGEVWRIGDELLDDGMVCEVVGIGPNRLYYYVDATDTVEWTQADSRRHHHAPTVEDVLREFGRGWHEQMNGPETFDISDYVERYAAKLRLAEGEGRMSDDEKVLTYEEAKQMCMKAFDAGALYGSESMRYGVNATAYDWEHWLKKNESLFEPKPTVEDVLREFAYGLGVPVADSYVAAAAAKLRLAGDAE